VNKKPSKEALKAILEKENYKRIQLSNTKWSHSKGTIEARWASIFLYKQIFDKQEKYLRPAFVYTLCSIIEERINDNLIGYFFSKFGEDYKRFVSIFLKLSIHDKLKVFVPIISEYKYDLIHDKKEIIAIRKLFEVRNQLIHMKNHYKQTVQIVDQDDIFYLSELDEQETTIYDNINYNKLDKKTLTEFYEAEKEFCSWTSDLFPKILRKDFKMGLWITELKKADSSVVIRVPKKKSLQTVTNYKRPLSKKK